MTYLRGALIEFMPTLLVPVPNVIMFQYNPETMTHTWTQPQAAQTSSGAPPGNPLAVKGSPGESFSFTLAMDASDTIADDLAGASLATLSGVYSRLAALEMLIHPSKSTTSEGLLGTVTSALSSLGKAAGGVERDVPANRLPIVLFVWGPERIVPVRATGLTITEKLYDGALNPTHAEAQLTLQVLTPEDLAAAGGDTLTAVAKAASAYTMSLRQALAIANVVNSADSVMGMIPH